MQVHFGVGLLRAEWRKAVVCVGTFDGVHLGHQTVIHNAVELAKSHELPCVLLTFDRHPAAVLAPSRCPLSVAGLQENLREFKTLGVSATVVLPFDVELSRMSAERFLREILLGSIRASTIVVGHDFAMGHGREGTTDWLSARVPTVVVPAFEIDGLRVSSSAIRRAITAGEMAHAKALLGRPFALSGVIVGGQKLGRQLGYPTANLARSFDQVMPMDGIYASWMETPLGRFKAATSIGTRPAVGGLDRTIESYLLDYPGDSIYGASVELELVRRVREERNFSSLDELVSQIERDVQEIRELMHS